MEWQNSPQNFTEPAQCTTLVSTPTKIMPITTPIRQMPARYHLLFFSIWGTFFVGETSALSTVFVVCVSYAESGSSMDFAELEKRTGVRFVIIFFQL